MTAPSAQAGLALIAGDGPAPRLIFVTPSHQCPTGRLMPIGRRLELLRFAADAGAAVVEDDYDGDAGRYPHRLCGRARGSGRGPSSAPSAISPVSGR